MSNPQNLNNYTYALNNPFKYIDPDGKIPDPSDAVVAGCGFGAPVCLVVKEVLETVLITGIVAIAGALSQTNDDVVSQPQPEATTKPDYTKPEEVATTVNTGPGSLTEAGETAQSPTSPSDDKKEDDKKTKKETPKEEADRKIGDIKKNPNDWEKINEKPDSKQTKGKRSIRELWQNKKTGEQLERHILEKNGKPVDRHPHYKNPTPNFW